MIKFRYFCFVKVADFWKIQKDIFIERIAGHNSLHQTPPVKVLKLQMFIRILPFLFLLNSNEILIVQLKYSNCRCFQ